MHADLELRLRALTLRAQDGDGAAWREVLTELQRRLAPFFARRLGSEFAGDVEDLVQETLIAMHTRRHTYDPSQPFTAWSYAIARYKMIDFWRRRRRRVHVPFETVEAELWTDGHAASEAAVDLGRLLADLPERQQRLVRDVKLEGLSLAEAGARRGMSEGAAKVSLHRALKILTGKAGRVDE